ncbi:MAG: N-acetyltransferase family protein [Caulobacteraceae bacterium]
MSVVEIRECKLDDLPEVILLMNELKEVASGGDQIEPENVRTIFLEMEKFPEIYLNLVAEVSGKVVGFISIIFYRTVFHKGGTALINELIITNSERGKGIGHSLIQRAKEEALARRLDEIEVGTEKTNLAAQRFYRKNGFDEEYVLMGMEFEPLT